MPTPHNNAQKGQIAKTVLMPGDPLRAKFIADTFLYFIDILEVGFANYPPQKLLLQIKNYDILMIQVKNFF